MFTPGQLVLCVDDNWNPQSKVEPTPHFPIKGNVYRIRDTLNLMDNRIGLYLEEIVCNKTIDGIEFSWIARAFRPLSNSALDVFREALNPIARPMELIANAVRNLQYEAQR